MDPYAGTGSILIAAAAFGAQVVGADIDVRVGPNDCDCAAFKSNVLEANPP